MNIGITRVSKIRKELCLGTILVTLVLVSQTLQKDVTKQN